MAAHIGTCKLCLQEKELMQSHIIPEFMYQHVYDDSPKRFYTIKVDLDDETKNVKKIEQKGIRERLLCTDCEGILSKSEHYAAKTLYAKKGATVEMIEQSRTSDKKYTLHKFVGFQYKEFKNFLNSILWRLLVTDEVPTFDGIDATKERLRVAVLNEDPLDYDDFGCLIQVIRLNPEEMASKFIMQAELMQTPKGIMVDKLVDGLMYSFYINSKDIDEKAKRMLLQTDGTLYTLGRLLPDDKNLYDKVIGVYKYFASVEKK